MDKRNEHGSVDAILMASGSSRRFGDENKLLAPFCGKPLCRHTLELAAGLGLFGRILLVWADPAVAALAEGLPVELVDNKHPQRGQRESVRLGVDASRAGHYLFFPCDQPLLDADTVGAILAQKGEGRIVTPMYRGNPGNPALFSAAFRQELLNLEEGQSARVIKARHPKAVWPVEVASPLPLADIDTVEDLRRLEGKMSWHS